MARMSSNARAPSCSSRTRTPGDWGMRFSFQIAVQKVRGGLARKEHEDSDVQRLKRVELSTPLLEKYGQNFFVHYNFV